MPKKIRELKQMLRQAGWSEIAGGGKGSHSKWSHASVTRRLVLSGTDGDDAKPYQERDVKSAIREAGKGVNNMANVTQQPRYTVIIQWSDEDQAYVVSLPEWGAGAKTHGATYEEAARNAEEVLELLMRDDPGAPEPQLFRFPGAVAVNLPEAAHENSASSAVKSRQSA
jgi:predicted RNase H-like HicB family nuclease/predicted RNA binding protein YcfA (HicA-like mRNA interferase family)